MTSLYDQLQPLPNHTDFQAGFELHDDLILREGGIESASLELCLSIVDSKDDAEAFEATHLYGKLFVKEDDDELDEQAIEKPLDPFTAGFLMSQRVMTLVFDNSFSAQFLRKVIDHLHSEQDLSEDDTLFQEQTRTYIQSFALAGFEHIGDTSSELVEGWSRQLYKQEHHQFVFKLGVGCAALAAYTLRSGTNAHIVEKISQEADLDLELENIFSVDTGE